MKLTDKDWDYVYYKYGCWYKKYQDNNGHYPDPYDCFKKLKNLVNQKIYLKMSDQKEEERDFLYSNKY